MFVEKEYEGDRLSDHVWNKSIDAGSKDDHGKESCDCKEKYNRTENRKKILCQNEDI